MLCIEEWGKVDWGSVSPLSNKLFNIVFQDMCHHLCWLLQLGKSLVSQTFIGCVTWQAGEEITNVSVIDFLLDGAGSWVILGAVRTASPTETRLFQNGHGVCLVGCGFVEVFKTSFINMTPLVSLRWGYRSFWNTQKECRRKWKPFLLSAVKVFIMSKVLIFLSKHKNQQQNFEN